MLLDNICTHKLFKHFLGDIKVKRLYADVLTGSMVQEVLPEGL
jgi:hypothetical protein